MENKLNYFNFLYATNNGFVGFESKLNKKEKKTLKAKLIWKRETKDSFAIEFAEWIVDYTFNGCYSNDVSELLEEFKKEKL